MQSAIANMLATNSSQFFGLKEKSSNSQSSLKAQDTKKMQEAYSKIDAKELTNSYLSFYQKQATQSSNSNFSAQFLTFSFASLGQNFSDKSKTPTKISDILSSINIKDTGYTGKDISALSKEEAADLVSEKGYFGINNTADRMAGFVINGAGDDLDKLKAGRDGILRGYNEAKKAWGDKLPEISEKTMKKALEAVDKRIAQLGGSVVDVKA